jgi:hypothetical protein
VAVIEVVPSPEAVTVATEPLLLRLATVELALFQVKVFPLIVFPLASFAVALIVVDSLGLRRTVDLLSATLLTVTGGGFVPPLSPPLPPQATTGQSTVVRTSFAARIDKLQWLNRTLGDGGHKTPLSSLPCE